MKRFALVQLMLFYLLMGHPLMAAEIPVNAGESVQATIDSANDGDTVRVVAGTYDGNIRIQDKSIQLLGDSAETTHLRGDGTDSVVTLINAGTSKVDGFRISNGTRSTYEQYYNRGGGIYCNSGSPTISNNIIEENDSRQDNGNENQGGGIFSEDANVTISDNIVQNNHSGLGAGICAGGGTIIVTGNTIQGNTCHSDHGGGLAVSGPDAVISHNQILNNVVAHPDDYGWGGGVIVFGSNSTNAMLSYNVISGNSAPSLGGGVFIDDGAEATLDHELIYGNTGVEGGGGVYVDGIDQTGSNVTVTHCTIADNTGGSRGGNGVTVEGHSQVAITNSIFWGNSDGEDFTVDATSAITVTYSLSEETISGTGNKSSDPLFVNAASADYQLSSSSPAIDTGDPASDYATEPDPDGERVNMGRYGNTTEAASRMLLEYAISILKLLTGTNAASVVSDMNNDGRIGLAEVVYVLQQLAR